MSSACPLAGREFISYQKNALALNSWFRHHFRKSSIRLNIVMTVDSVQAVISGIEHHMGLGIIASHFAYGDIQQGRIIPITTNRKEIINRISLVQLQDKILSLTEKMFQSHFKTAMRQPGVLEKFSKIFEPLVS